MFVFHMKVLFKNRISAAFLWLVPIFFLFGAAVIGNQLLKEEARVQPFAVAVVNEDPTFETKLVIEQFTDSRHLNGIMTTKNMKRNEAKTSLRNNKIAAIIHIPKGFSRDVAKGKNTPVKVTGNLQRPLQSELVRQVMESAANYTSAAQSGINTVYHFMEEEYFSSKDKKAEYKKDILSFSLHVLGRNGIYEEIEQENLFQQSLIDYYAVSFYVLLIMIWSYLGLLLLKTNVNGAIPLRLTSIGVSPFHFAFARMLAAWLLVSVSSLVLAFGLLYWQGFDLIGGIGQFTVGTLLLAAVFTTLFMMLEALLRSDKLLQFVSVVVILCSAAIGEHFIPAVYFPEWLQQVNLFSLNGWMLKFMFSIVGDGAVHSSWEIGSGLLLIVILNIGLIRIFFGLRRV